METENALTFVRELEETTKTFNLIFNNFIFFFLQANGLASVGKYAAGSVVGAGADATLFVANHAY